MKYLQVRRTSCQWKQWSICLKWKNGTNQGRTPWNADPARGDPGRTACSRVPEAALGSRRSQIRAFARLSLSRDLSLCCGHQGTLTGKKTTFSKTVDKKEVCLKTCVKTRLLKEWSDPCNASSETGLCLWLEGCWKSSECFCFRGFVGFMSSRQVVGFVPAIIRPGKDKEPGRGGVLESPWFCLERNQLTADWGRILLWADRAEGFDYRDYVAS